MPGPLVPEDDLYARLEVGPDASSEAIELAWRALLKRHHPDVAGDSATSLDRAKRINVAHDWLADPALRARYDRERLGPASSRNHAVRSAAWSPRGRSSPHAAAPHPPRRRPASRPDLFRGEPAERLARFLARVERLRRDELDRLAAAEPPPIAFLATIRRFVTPEARESFAQAEAALALRVPHARWVETGVREGLLAVAAELVLAPFLDETLAEPFRSRARERLLRAWEASVDQPRYGPNGIEVGAVLVRLAAMSRDEVAAFVRASQGIAGDDRPWPAALDRDEDEALRISAALAAGDAAAAIPVEDLGPAAAGRARRLAGRLGHVVALRHAFAPGAYGDLVAPYASATGDRREAATGPDVRRAD